MKFSNIFLLSSIFLYSFIYATDSPIKSKGVKSVERFLESKQIDIKTTNAVNQDEDFDSETYKILTKKLKQIRSNKSPDQIKSKISLNDDQVIKDYIILKRIKQRLILTNEQSRDRCEFFDCVGTEACGYEEWLADGICDDGTWGIDYNCEAFNWDEGDCSDDDSGGGECGDGECGDGEDSDSCPEDCEDGGGEEGCEGSGGIEDWIADGWCDASNNMAACGYDGGDCCPGDCVDSAYDCATYGGDCSTCVDPDSVDLAPGGDCDGDGGGDGGGEDCEFFDCVGTEACGYEDWVGDGYCDNSDSPYGFNYYCEEFNWDEGDCDDDGSGGECGDGECGDGEDSDSCPEDCGDGGGEEGCEEGYLDDCSGDGDCCPEEWVGDGYADCEDQPWGCDLSCYDNDNGDCDDDGGGTECGDGECGDGEDSDSCPEDCGDGGCDGFLCNDGTCIIASYENDSWCDCSQCEDEIGAGGCYYDGDCCDCMLPDNCPDDCSGGDGECGDGECGDGEDSDSCPEDCGNGGGECEFFDCAGTEACGYEDWVGDGYCDNSDSAYGINYYCEEFNWDEGDCDDDGGGGEGCEEGYADDCSGDGDCCPEEWIGDGFADCEDQPWGCDLTCYDNDNGDCDDDGGGECGDGECGDDEDSDSCPEDCGNDGGGVSMMIGDSTGNPGESVEVSLFYESSESIGGIQFTIEDSPDWLVSVNLVASSDDCFEASFNEIDGSLIGILFSFEGCELGPSDSMSHFSTITYELSSEASWGSEIELSFSDAIVSDGVGNSLPVTTQGGVISVSLLGDVSLDSEINILDVVTLISYVLYFEEPTDYQFWAGDVNSDGNLNILDVVILIDMILESP